MGVAVQIAHFIFCWLILWAFDSAVLCPTVADGLFLLEVVGPCPAPRAFPQWQEWEGTYVCGRSVDEP